MENPPTVQRLARRPCPRGPGPLVSVLLPTRGRPALLRGALESLYSLAADPLAVEVLLKVDDDDATTLELLGEFHNGFDLVRAVVSPRGEGYWDMHHWVNDLASKARGDWLLVWNDDARMLTPGWDDVLLDPDVGQEDEILACACRVLSRPGSHEFFFVRRKVFEVLEHLSLNPHIDSWLWPAMTVIERAVFTNIRVEHFNDRLNDTTAQERKVICEFSVPSMTSPSTARRRMADAERLLVYIESFWADRGVRFLSANERLTALGVQCV